MSQRRGGRQTILAPRARLTAAPDEILARAPLRQAAEQMRPAEAGEKGPWLGSAYHSRSPLPTRPQVHPYPDFAGIRIDRLTVVGLVDEPAGKCSARWLVRCDCGLYETRRGAGLAGRMRTDRARCRRCDYLLHLQHQAHFDRHGRWPVERPEFRKIDAPISMRPAPPAPPPPPPPPDPNDKGNRGKGDRTAQRRRARARKLMAQAAERRWP